MALAKKVKLNGSTTQKNLGANTQNKMSTIIERKKYSQYFPVDFVVSIILRFYAKLRAEFVWPIFCFVYFTHILKLFLIIFAPIKFNDLDERKLFVGRR